MSWLEALRRKHRRGSLPRCLLLTDGEPAVVAERLTRLVNLESVHVGEEDVWMPRGLPLRAVDGAWDVTPCIEARIGKTSDFLTDTQREEILGWWVVRRRAQPPNWDIACTATIEARPGLILIEAKAHSGELKTEDRCTSRNPQNQASIAAAIQEANAALNTILPGWTLSPDSQYQLANRLAWSWKIASLGVPVILVYLGFLRAEEMRDQGEPFADASAWDSSVRAYSQGIVPESVWNTRMVIQDTPLRVLLRSIEVDLPEVGLG
jgi:hypothetical protein